MRSAFPVSVTMAGSEITGPGQFEALLPALCASAKSKQKGAANEVHLETPSRLGCERAVLAEISPTQQFFEQNIETDKQVAAPHLFEL